MGIAKFVDPNRHLNQSSSLIEKFCGEGKSEFRRNQTDAAFLPSILGIKLLDSLNLFVIVAPSFHLVPTPVDKYRFMFKRSFFNPPRGLCVVFVIPYPVKRLLKTSLRSFGLL